MELLLIQLQRYDKESIIGAIASNLDIQSVNILLNYIQNQTGHDDQNAIQTQRVSKSSKSLMNEFEVAMDVIDFKFDGNKQIGFNLNIGQYMEVSTVKQDGQAQQLGVLQSDILMTINDQNVCKNWERATNLLREYVQKKKN